jgi:Cu(I)/Ag(I) efflux system membrane protein CusA/SilA
MVTNRAGLLPLMRGSGIVSEVKHRIAAPMVNGVISSTVLALDVIPALYASVKQWQLVRESRATPAPIAVPQARAPTA